jgi:hypothetical protein
MTLRWRRHLIIVGGLLLLALALRTIASQPTWIHSDEALYLNIGRTYIDRGELTLHMWRLPPSNIIAGSGSGYAIILLGEYLQAVNLSLFAARLLMVVLGIVAALLMGWVAYRWWGHPAAGIGALLFGLASTSPFYTMLVRMDAPGIVGYSLLLGLYWLGWQRRSRWIALAVGVFTVLNAEVHIISAVYLVMFALLYFVQYVQTVREARRLVFNSPPVYFVAGSVLTGILYLALHVLPDPETYFFISSRCFECAEPFWITELKRAVRYIAMRPLELLLVGAVVIVGAARKEAADRHYLWVFGCAALAQAIVGTPPYVHYTSHLWPIAALGVGGWVARGRSGQFAVWRLWVAYGVAVGLLTFNIALHWRGQEPYLLVQPPYSGAALAYLQQFVPTDTVVMGRGWVYGSLVEYGNFLAFHEGDYSALLQNQTVLDFWREQQPEAIVFSDDEFAQDADLQTYMLEKDFREVVPDLWISAVLRQQIAS